MKYKGDVILGNTYTIDPISHKRKINMGEQDKYYIENHHEPIISKEMWDKVQEIMNARRQSRNCAGIKDGYYNVKYAFSNIMECAFCGRVMTRKKWGKGKVGWQCSSSLREGRRLCECSKVIPQEVLEKAFIEVHKTLLANNQELVDNFFQKVEKAIKKNDTLSNIGRLKEKEKSIQNQIRKLLDMSLNEVITEEEYQTKKEELEKRLSEINKRITKSVGTAKIEEKIRDRVFSMKSNLNKKKDIIDCFDESAFKCLVKKIIIGEDYGQEKDPYVLNFILNSDKTDDFDDEDWNMKLAEFDCNVRYSVFNIDENNNRTRELKDSIKVKVFSDIDLNINISSQ